MAYVVSRFPKVTETFVLNEMIALEELGVQVELFPLRRRERGVQQPAARGFVQRAHYPRLGWALVAANLDRFGRAPLDYLRHRIEKAGSGALEGTVGALFRRLVPRDSAVFQLTKKAYWSVRKRL